MSVPEVTVRRGFALGGEQLPSRSVHVSLRRRLCRELGPTNRTLLRLSARCGCVGFRLGQLCFALGECSLGTSCSAPKSTAFGLSAGLGRWIRSVGEKNTTAVAAGTNAVHPMTALRKCPRCQVGSAPGRRRHR